MGRSPGSHARRDEVRGRYIRQVHGSLSFRADAELSIGDQYANAVPLNLFPHYRPQS